MTGNRCGASTASGRCRRRVRAAGQRCHLHPAFGVTLDRSLVIVHVSAELAINLASGVRPPTFTLSVRDALELARAIQRACTQLDERTEP